MNKLKMKQQGVGLVEVMIAIIIVAVGILGISKLQINVVRSGVDANNRAVAAIIAQNKIDDLRSYARLDNASRQNTISLNNLNRHTFEDIGTNTGGEFATGSTTVLRIPSGTVDTAQLNLPTNTNYDLNWTLVNNYFYNADFVPATTSTATPTLPSYKLLEVTVSWTDVNGTPQSHSMRTIIEGYSPLFTSKFGSANYGSAAPIVPYTPELAPDVVPVTLDIGNKKRESSKPIPEISKKGDSTTVRFETVTYDNLINNVADTVTREEFLTAKCLCSNGASSDNSIQIKGKTIWNDTLEQLEDTVELISLASPILKTDVDNSGGEEQAAECSIVCRQSLDPATGSLKIARLKRINGVLRVFNDWQLVAFNVIPASYFNSGGTTSRNSLTAMDVDKQAENIEKYSDYTIAVVRDALGYIDSNGVLPVVDTSFASYLGVNAFNNSPVGTSTLDHTRFVEGAINNRQLQARALYMDIPPTGFYNNSGGANFTAANVPLDRVPFYENNFTQLAGWIPDVLVGASGSNAGDLAFTTPPTYTTKHDEINSCSPQGSPYNGIASLMNGKSYPTNRNFVTNQQLTYGNSFTECANASRGLFYPIKDNSVAGDNVALVGTSVDIVAKIYNGNNGIVDFAVVAGEAATTDTLTVQVFD